MNLSVLVEQEEPWMGSSGRWNQLTCGNGQGEAGRKRKSAHLGSWD